MTSILLTDAEWDGLLDESAELLKVYLFLRRAMDFKTGISRGFTEIDIRDVLRVPAVRGRKKENTTELSDVSRQHARTILQRLQKLGYIEPLRDQGALVFELPHGVGVIASRTMTNRSPTKHQPDDQPHDQPKKRTQRVVNKENPTASSTASPHDDQPYDDAMTNRIEKDGNTVRPKRSPLLRSGCDARENPTSDESSPVSASGADAPLRPPKATGETDAIREARRATWKSYADAYFARYGVEPVRNAKVNRHVADLVARLGATEAPDVANWYLTHNASHYVRRQHDIGALLADCEALRTQWATGRRMTETRARQIDQTQANHSATAEALEILRRRHANG